jgi:hypothetical protein
MWTYLTALRYGTAVSTGVALATVLDTAAHDRLTRRLRGHWVGPTRLDVALRAWSTVMGGEWILADPLGDKPSAARREAAAWVWSTTQNTVVFGLPVVLWVWTHGQGRLPLACRLWPKGGPSTLDWALEWLSSARHWLRVTPRVVVGAAWSP